MQIHFGTELLQPEWTHCVACIGTFDGVHLGHQAVISKAVEEARARELPCMLITFDRHPASVVAPDRVPPAVATLGTNLREFQRMGAAATLVLPFTKELSQKTAEDFYQEILIGAAKATAVVVGHDFAFGHGRQGNTEWLRERIATVVVPPFEIEGERVSSSAIRAAISEGRVEDAARWLGRPFEVQGVVVGGQKLGRTLGYPTINLARTSAQVVPAHGIYSGSCETAHGDFAAAISVGVRPTVGGGERTIEAYLLDYPGESLYGRSVTLRWTHRLREERHFDSLHELQAQMAHDVAEVRRLS
jgi:riboflavin kinase / FMN adenylyltransferase